MENKIWYLAFLIGVTREAVADQLKELKQEGLVETSYRGRPLDEARGDQGPACEMIDFKM